MGHFVCTGVQLLSSNYSEEDSAFSSWLLPALPVYYWYYFITSIIVLFTLTLGELAMSWISVGLLKMFLKKKLNFLLFRAT